MWFSKRATTVAAPFLVAPTGEFDGSDGKWSTFKIDVGTPPQEFRVTVSAVGDAIWIPKSPGACDPTDSTVPSDCSSVRGIDDFQGGVSDGFQDNKSSTYSLDGLYQLSLTSELDKGSMTAVYGSLYNISAYYGRDTVALKAEVGDGNVTIQNVPFAEYNDYYITLGSLGLAWGVVQPGTATYSTYMQTVLDSKDIPSRSWSYTAGASYRNGGYTGSLVLGGYDESRFEPNNSTFLFPPSTEQTLLKVNVKNMAMDFSNGSSYALTVDSKSQVNTFDAILDPTFPFFYLPESVVDDLQNRLGLSYDQDNDLYIFNGTDFDSSIQSFDLTLTDTQSGQNSTSITLPRAAFALNASWPYYGSSQAYFPIRKAVNGNNILGRVFFQEAYVVADFERGNFSISQAQFPNPPASSVVAIDSTTTSSDNSSHSSSLSGGAIAGIVIGSVVGVLLIAAAAFFFWRRRRRAQRSQLQAELFAAAEDEKAREAMRERRETYSTVMSESTMVSHEMDARGGGGLAAVGRPTNHTRGISELSSESERDRARKAMSSPSAIYEMPDTSGWEANQSRLNSPGETSPRAPSPLNPHSDLGTSEAPSLPDHSPSLGVVSPASPTLSQRGLRLE